MVKWPSSIDSRAHLARGSGAASLGVSRDSRLLLGAKGLPEVHVARLHARNHLEVTDPMISSMSARGTCRQTAYHSPGRRGWADELSFWEGGPCCMPATAVCGSTLPCVGVLCCVVCVCVCVCAAVRSELLLDSGLHQPVRQIFPKRFLFYSDT